MRRDSLLRHPNLIIIEIKRVHIRRRTKAKILKQKIKKEKPKHKEQDKIMRNNNTPKD